MTITVTLTKEEIENAIRENLRDKFIVKNDAKVSFKYGANELILSADVECSDKKKKKPESTYFDGKD